MTKNRFKIIIYKLRQFVKNIFIPYLLLIYPNRLSCEAGLCYLLNLICNYHVNNIDIVYSTIM